MTADVLGSDLASVWRPGLALVFLHRALPTQSIQSAAACRYGELVLVLPVLIYQMSFRLEVDINHTRTAALVVFAVADGALCAHASRWTAYSGSGSSTMAHLTARLRYFVRIILQKDLLLIGDEPKDSIGIVLKSQQHCDCDRSIVAEV